MKEKLETIVGKAVLNGESASGSVVKLAKVVNYLSTQLTAVKRELNDDADMVNYIDGVMNSASEMLEE